MKKLLLIIGLLAVGLGLRAQDQAIFMHYNVAPVLVNPAAAGFSEQHDIMFNFRNQWTGFPGAPYTYGLNYNGPIGKTLGVGVNVLSENIASINRLKLQLNYAFRFNVEQVHAAFGFSTEFQNLGLNNDVFNNGFYEAGDQAIDAFESGEQIFDASVGIYTTIRDKFTQEDRTFIGLAFPNLILSRLNDIERGTREGAFLKYYVFMIGHKFDVDGSNVTIEPSLMMRQLQNTPLNVDINLKAGFLDDSLITGLSYRAGTGGIVGLLLGTDLNGFRIFYSFDLSFQEFQQFSSGSHEVTLSLRLDGKKKNGN
jgi:type IX secretion system PorP/SprF family membrane protein